MSLPAKEIVTDYMELPLAEREVPAGKSISFAELLKNKTMVPAVPDLRVRQMGR